MMTFVFVVLIDDCQRNSETFIRNLFFIIRVISSPIYIQYGFLTGKQRSNIQLYLYIRFVFIILQVIKIPILPHQTLVIGSIDESGTGTS